MRRKSTPRCTQVYCSTRRSSHPLPTIPSTRLSRRPRLISGNIPLARIMLIDERSAQTSQDGCGSQRQGQRRARRATGGSWAAESYSYLYLQWMTPEQPPRSGTPGSLHKYGTSTLVMSTPFRSVSTARKRKGEARRRK